MTVERGGGVLKVCLEIVGGRAKQVKVDMGEPILDRAAIPTKLPAMTSKLDVAGLALEVTCVSMGNPHCVIYVDAITDEQVLVLGPKVEKHPGFPKRTNVEFVRVNRPDD